MSTCPTCGTKYGPNVHLCTHDGTVLEEDNSPEQQQVGKILAGKYRLDAPLSHGGMGVVYKATHVMLNKPVAVKLIKSDLAVSPEIARRFQREARAASNLNHPNIVAVYDLGQTEDGTLYIAMELVNGPSLKDVIKTGGAIDAPRIVRILRPVASALSLAHRNGIIHRDLKPQNIMLADAGDGTEVPKLLDFGIAKTFDEATAQLTATGFALGTPQYMSPEQALGKQVDARADIYSFGIILYEMLVGDVPFTDQSTAAILVKQVNEQPVRPSLRRAEVSPALEAIALRCMEKDPANRFQSADELVAALDAAGASSSGAFDATLPAASATVVLPQSTQPYAPTAAKTAVAQAAPDAGQGSAPPAVPPLPATAAAATVPQAPAAGDPAASTHPTVPMTPEAKPQPPVDAAGKPAAAGAKPAGGRGPILILAAAVVVLVAAGVGAWRLGYLPVGTGQVAQSNLVAGPPPPGTPATGAAQAPAAATGQSPGTPPAQTPATETPQTPPATEQPVVPPGASTAEATPPVTEPTTRATEAPAVTAPTSRAQSERRTGGARVPRAKTSPSSAARSTASGGATGDVTTPAGAGAGRLTQGAGQAPAAARETAPALPEHPSIFLRCSGPQEICSAARATFTQAMHRTGMLPAASPGSADVVLQVTAAVVDERSEEAYGATFMVRTYSLDVDGNATRFREAITMPEPRTFSFDSRYTSQRAMDNTRASANAAIESVREYWAKKRQ